MDHLLQGPGQGAEQKWHLMLFGRSCPLMLYFKKVLGKASPHAAGVTLGQTTELAKFTACAAVWDQPAAASAHAQGFCPKTMHNRALEPCRRQLCAQRERHPQQTRTFTTDRAQSVTSCLPQLTRDLQHLLCEAQ